MSRTPEDFRPSPFSDLSRPAWWFVLLLVPALFGVVSLGLGQDFNWDLRSYHYYNAYAFLENRMGFDIAAAERQTYHNPLVEVPFFWLRQRVPPRVVGFVFGFVHGLNFVLVFLIYWAAAAVRHNRTKVALGLFTATFACLAPRFIIRVGTTFNDNVVSLFVLASLLLLVWTGWLARRSGGRVSVLLLSASAVVMGAGVGLKLTATFFAPAGAAVILALAVPWRRRVPAFIVFVAAGIAGALMTSGFWMARLWRDFGNPVFPYLNHVFRSPEVDTIPFEYSGFADLESWSDVERLSDVLSGAREVILGSGYLWLTLGLLTVTGLVGLVRRLRHGRGALVVEMVTIDAAPNRSAGRLLDGNSGNLLLVFCGVAFVLWARMFAIERYLLPVTLLSPLIALVALDRLLSWNIHKYVAFASFVLLSLATSQTPSNPRVDWDEEIFAITNPKFGIQEEGLVVIVDRSPVACYIPAFPPGVAFVRPSGGLKLSPEHALYQRIVRRIREYEGPIYLLFDRRSVAAVERRSQRLGLKFKERYCRRLLRPEDRGRTVICPAKRESEPSVSPALVE